MSPELDINKMNCLFASVLFILTILASEIDCGRKKNTSPRFRDTAEALNYLHERLPDQISMEEKCKRYAVLSSKALDEKSPYEKTVLDVLSMDQQQLNSSYDKMHTDRLIHVLVSAIDRYRITKLAPAFIDLIDCLSRIDTPEVSVYLNNHEIVLILDLYKQVLGLPGTKVDPKSLRPEQFCRAFWTALVNLFHQHFEIFRQDSSNGAEASQLSEKQMRKQIFANQRRERSRLVSQRWRILDPKGIRKYQNDRRKKASERDRSVMSLTFETPEVADLRRRALERRDKANALQRSRRQRYRLLQHQQRVQKEIQRLTFPEDDLPDVQLCNIQQDQTSDKLSYGEPDMDDQDGSSDSERSSNF